MLHNIELQHLRYFIAVAEKKDHHSMTDVAVKLNIEQSNLSQQIKNLENKLKVTLFNRKKRPIQLTKAGEEFLKEARLILNQVDRAIETAKLAHNGQIGRLIVGFNSSISNSVLPDILIKFRALCPDVKLILQEHTANSLIKGLETQQIDIALMHWSELNHKKQGLCVKLIKKECLVLVLPENHYLATQTEISLKSLANESFILPPSHLSYSLYEQIVNLCSQVGFVPKVTQEATLMLTILSLVAGGMGISLLPINVENIQRKGVVYRKIQEQTPMLKIVAVYREDNSSVVLSKFLKAANL
ncbi:MAG TPA: LysR family transcriptional regulator [Allocoleopsis sp.]